MTDIRVWTRAVSPLGDFHQTPLTAEVRSNHVATMIAIYPKALYVLAPARRGPFFSFRLVDPRSRPAFFACFFTVFFAAFFT